LGNLVGKRQKKNAKYTKSETQAHRVTQKNIKTDRETRQQMLSQTDSVEERQNKHKNTNSDTQTNIIRHTKAQRQK